MKCISYKDYLDNRKLYKDANILIGKTKNSILIGPKINDNFDEEFFYKRIKSNSVFGTNIYKKIREYKYFDMINNYYNELDDNEVIEIIDKKHIRHNIISIPRGINEK